MSEKALTLEQLREMCGEPVWIERHDGGQSRWAIVGDCDSLYGVYFGTSRGGLRLPYDECGKSWIPYRNKPELWKMYGEPVAHGFWNIEQPINYRVKPWSVSCSICGWSTTRKTNYCSNCGSKMDADTSLRKP